MKHVILASNSQIRAQILKNAGIVFQQQAANIEERAIEQPLLEANALPADIAELLAIAKAQDVSRNNKDTYVIGADQILALENEILHKPKNMEDARQRLLKLSGKTHELQTAVALVYNEEILWSSVEIATIKFRKLTPKFIGQHLAQAGDDILQSVGAYQIEGLGVQLFEEIKGDIFTIMGLPILPLLEAFRKYEIIEA